MHDTNDFANRLKMLRLTKMVSRAQMSEETGIPVSSLGNYERGDKIPSLDILRKICDYFNVSADYLIGLSDIQERSGTWPLSVPDDKNVKENIHVFKEAVENMLASVQNNSYGLQTFDSYATIINLLPDIDKFVAAQLGELQIDYPEYRAFGAETELQFEGKPLLQALVDRSEEATKFAKRLTATKTRIQDKIIEIHSVIGDVLGIWVFDAIKGLPLEKQPLYVDQLRKAKQSLGEEHQATETKDADGGEDGGNSQETRE